MWLGTFQGQTWLPKRTVLCLITGPSDCYLELFSRAVSSDVQLQLLAVLFLSMLLADMLSFVRLMLFKLVFQATLFLGLF